MTLTKLFNFSLLKLTWASLSYLSGSRCSSVLWSRVWALNEEWKAFPLGRWMVHGGIYSRVLLLCNNRIKGWLLSVGWRKAGASFYLWLDMHVTHAASSSSSSQTPKREWREYWRYFSLIRAIAPSFETHPFVSAKAAEAARRGEGLVVDFDVVALVVGLTARVYCFPASCFSPR